MQALNEVALAMERVLTPEEIFAAVAEESKKFGLCRSACARSRLPPSAPPP